MTEPFPPDFDQYLRWMGFRESDVDKIRQRDIQTDEPLWWLRSCQISTYYASSHWRALRSRFLDSVEPECALCGLRVLDAVPQEEAVGVGTRGLVVHDSSATIHFEMVRPLVEIRLRAPQWTVHHVTYERLGEERLDDLRLLCSPCHQLVHRPSTVQARRWVEHHASSQPSLAERAAEMCPTDYPWERGPDPGIEDAP